MWERPLRRKEIEQIDAQGGSVPEGPILGARVEHLGAKEALLDDDPRVFFTTSHFDGYPAILARLELISEADLDQLITEAWLNRAPAKVVSAWLAESRRGE